MSKLNGKQIYREEKVHVLDTHSNVWAFITEIADSGLQEEAFYVCDIGDIVRKHKTWMTLLPRIKPYYAVKCNDSLTVLEVLAALGTGFDCASQSEINKVLSLGVSPDRIIFANPTKPATHIRYALSAKVSTMTFDNEAELHKVKRLFPTAKMVIRIRCDSANAHYQLGLKFGCDSVTEAPRLLQVARSLDLDVVGVSFHVGSGSPEASAFKEAIAKARDVFDYGATLGYRFDLLDVGGGYPGEHGSSLNEIAEVINSALEDHFPDPSLRIIAEPGRYYVTSAYTLACNIHSIRDIPNKDNSIRHRMYYIDEGVYGNLGLVKYENEVITPLPLRRASASQKSLSCSIWGPTCCALDQVIKEALLPEMNIGDWIVFEDMGAYTITLASSFNGFPQPKVLLVVDESAWLVLTKGKSVKRNIRN